MKELQEYIEESLLDDFDDLEKEADDYVGIKTSFGGEYRVVYVMVYNLSNVLKEIDKQKLKKMTPKYKGEYKIYTQSGKVAKTPNTKYIDTLVRCIMDLENIDDEFEDNLDDFLGSILKGSHVIKVSDTQIRIHLTNYFDEIAITIKKL